MSDLFTALWARAANALYREQGQAVTEYAIVLVVVALIAAAFYKAGIDQTIVKKITDSIGKI